MNIVVVHNPVSEHSPEDERDVLVQAGEVSGALELLGFRPVCVPFEFFGDTFTKHIRETNPACIFNLVESVNGDARLIHVAPSFFDHLGIPYTGSSAQAMFLTSNKVLSKKFMILNHIDTPQWYVPGYPPVGELVFPGTYIIKALWEEASVGINDESIVKVRSREELERFVLQRSRQLGCECFAEQYIEGREFNISLLSRQGNIEVLPAAEIRFDLPDKKYKIVDYMAKWDQDSPEYKGTKRSFDFPPEDAALIEHLRRIAEKCWSVFELRGYNRVDFRIDAQGKPFVLEINANPCISPDSGFVASAQRAGLTYPEIIERILLDAIPDTYTQYKKPYAGNNTL